MIVNIIRSTSDVLAIIAFPFLLVGALTLVYYANKWRIEEAYRKYKEEHPDE